jgi:hypothetical protein
VNKKILLLGATIIVIILLTGFYWFQVRPSQIKHDCSWVKMHDNAVPARPAMTKEELIRNGIIRSCNNEIEALKKVIPDANYKLGDMSVHETFMPSVDGVIRSLFDDPLGEATSCIEDGNKVIAAYKNSIPAIPAKDWYEKATPQEYTFCLHDKGL